MGGEAGEKYAMWRERQKVIFSVVVDQVRRVAFSEA